MTYTYLKKEVIKGQQSGNTSNFFNKKESNKYIRHESWSLRILSQKIHGHKGAYDLG